MCPQQCNGDHAFMSGDVGPSVYGVYHGRRIERSLGLGVVVNPNKEFAGNVLLDRPGTCQARKHEQQMS